MSADWQQKAQRKRSELAAKIPPEWRLAEDLLHKVDQLDNILDIPAQSGLLSEQELLITNSPDATALLERLTRGEVSAVEVTSAFCKRAAIAQQLTSCLTEIFFDQALARAEELDRFRAETGKPVGALHGLPISLKDSYSVAGVHSTLGYVSFLDRPPLTVNSAMVDILLAAGAVIYVKTNLPQTMMTADSHNNIFGRTRNPYGRLLTAGGSCGGEGALLAMRGSILGVGTDVAGSIRIPSLCCGLVGFKPSIGRLPYTGQTPPGRLGLAGGIGPVCGPLCHSTRDAELFVRTVLASHPENFDDMSLGFPWIEPSPLKPKLRVGILLEDPKFPVHPCMYRVLTTAARKLSTAGHHIIDLSQSTEASSPALPSLSEACDLASRFFNMDPDETPLAHVRKGGEPFIPSLSLIYNLDGTNPEPTLRELYDLNIAKAKVAAQMRQVYVDKELDFVLAPGYQSCAPLMDAYGSAVYTVFWNLVDYPTCVIPFGQANEEADASFVRDVVYNPPYKPKEVEGAPCHLQVVGRRLKEEALLQHARLVEKVLSEKD